jgi:uncharacterized protein
MKMSIGHLLNEPGSSLNYQFLLEQDSLKHDEFKFLQPVKVQGVMTNTGNEINLAGKVSTQIEGYCSRCIEPVIQDYVAEFDEVYELEEFESEDPCIDLGQCAWDFLMASLPVKMLCGPDCPGLCIHCGKPLKEGACDCRHKDIDPRLAALKGLLK